ncbi:MAG: hypothetical protein SV775_15665 [Thermodesulfobacteriota bacterium]|nr:hypothetical protein [Thermodesulfobacteriota bacterium]
MVNQRPESAVRDCEIEDSPHKGDTEVGLLAEEVKPFLDSLLRKSTLSSCPSENRLFRQYLGWTQILILDMF